MFESLPPAQQDPILSLSQAFKIDDREQKLDLGIGVYRDDTGVTPIMQAVKLAADKVLKTEKTLAYVGLAGNEAYNQAMIDLVMPESLSPERISAVQTPGASGALRILADLLVAAKPEATVWLSTPSYVNHQPIMQAAGLKVDFYPYFAPQTKMVDEAAFLDKVAELRQSDILLLHGCCHNPTGADLSPEAWEQVAQLATENGFTPFIDLAYHGFGDGLEADIFGIRQLAEKVPEMLLAVSNSKNFGLYRERTGVAILLGENAESVDKARGKFFELARRSYTMPPDWGATLVAEILGSSDLTATWRTELESMQSRMLNLREQLVAELKNKSGGQRFDYLLAHKGMFSLTGLSDDQIQQLKSEFGIYIVKGGRINIAGLNASQIPYLADALIKVGA